MTRKSLEYIIDESNIPLNKNLVKKVLNHINNWVNFNGNYTLGQFFIAYQDVTDKFLTYSEVDILIRIHAEVCYI